MLDYARGTVANLSFRATDDYEVQDVKLMARPEGGKYHDMPLEKTRTGYYTVEIPVSFHQNGTVDFYVLATDLSGHETDTRQPGPADAAQAPAGFPADRAVRLKARPLLHRHNGIRPAPTAASAVPAGAFFSSSSSVTASPGLRNRLDSRLYWRV